MFFCVNRNETKNDKKKKKKFQDLLIFRFYFPIQKVIFLLFLFDSFTELFMKSAKVSQNNVRHIIIKQKLAQPFIFLLDDFALVFTDGMFLWGIERGLKWKENCFRFKRCMFVCTSQVYSVLIAMVIIDQRSELRDFLQLIGYAKAINLNEACFLFQFKKSYGVKHLCLS